MGSEKSILLYEMTLFSLSCFGCCCKRPVFGLVFLFCWRYW